MKGFWFGFLWLFPLSVLWAQHPLLDRVRYGTDWIYQSILINGEEIFRSSCTSGGGEVIEQRYHTIKQILSKFNRPFTVLDLGANNGYFSLRIVRDFDAVCVLIDGTERLGDICTLNTETNRLIYIKKFFTKQDIQELARREHFDVVLACHILHHVDDWMSWLSTLFTLGDEVIIETPSENDPINKRENTKQLARYLTSLPRGVLIGRFPREGDFDHMLWFSQKGTPWNRFGILPSTFLYFGEGYPRRTYVETLNEQKGMDKWVLQGIEPF